MRRVVFALLVLPVAALACAHEPQKVPAGPAINEIIPAVPPVPPQFVVADPMSSKAVVVPLGAPGAFGLVVEKRRVVLGHGEPRVASDTAQDPIVGASKIPSRFGSGFLFWSMTSIYRADSFDAKLAPVTRVPDPIDSVSFGPKSIIARTKNGERWAFTLPNGDRAAIAPLGIADVQALDDGRAIAFNDQGAVFTSVDHGAKWTDATAHVKSAPAKISILGGEIYLIESSSGASRLEADGRLSWFDKAPPESPVEVRVKDPRWHSNDPPLRVAFRGGASIDDNTAIVIEGGDLVRLDAHTGDVVSVIAGRLPPDAQCEGLPIQNDVVFACQSKSGGSSFVVSRTVGGEQPLVEQTLAAGGVFFASDDGGLAYSMPCGGVAARPGSGSSTATMASVCVRVPGGRWEDRDLSGLQVDGGAPVPGDVSVARYIPRSDGRVVAIVLDPQFGVYDPQSAVFTPLPDDAREAVGNTTGGPSRLRPGIKRPRGKTVGPGVLDDSWSFTGNGSTLRGWQKHGGSVEIGEDGKVTRSPFTFDVVFAGAMGLGRSTDGRLYQSNDHGANWTEIATPPAGIEANDLISCTSAGCDLGAFYRVGWGVRPPRIEAKREPAPYPAEIRRTKGLELTCRPQGAVASKVLPRSNDSPEDLGLGVSRLQVANEKNEWTFVRNVIPRSLSIPLRDMTISDDGTPSLRGMLSGFGTNRDGDTMTVNGPNKAISQLRRGLSYVPPFDPVGRVVRTGIALSDVLAAGRRAGMTTDEILTDDPTETGAIFPLTPTDATAIGDVIVHNVDRGLVTIVRGERSRVALRQPQNSAAVISGVALPNDETALLELDSSGVGHVYKVGAGGISDLFDVSPTANESFYPANPDALAVDAKGNLAILRTPSGSDPASALDPAFLLVQAMPPTQLAPWSELKLADDPACKAEPGGHRATLQIIAPWIRVTTPELRVDEAPMLARVRWTPKRVCLEGFEVKLPSVTVRVTSTTSTVEPITLSTWLIAKGSTFARVAVGEGVEWRQQLECTLNP